MSVNPEELRTAIVVASVHHGNTMKLAKTLAASLNADVFDAEKVTAESLLDYDFIGFGSGIYFGRHHVSIRQLAASIDSPPKAVFIFSTAGLPFLSPLFHWPLRRILRKIACRISGEFSCRGWDTVGPLVLICGINRNHPNDKDLRNAETFAAGLSPEHAI